MSKGMDHAMRLFIHVGSCLLLWFLCSCCNCHLLQAVVVLRVSLHCKGCEGKVRKHLSRMAGSIPIANKTPLRCLIHGSLKKRFNVFLVFRAGVTSFNIDFAAKKVTIVGDVTPDGVLSSVSRVKNAQFWTSPAVHK